MLYSITENIDYSLTWKEGTDNLKTVQAGTNKSASGLSCSMCPNNKSAITTEPARELSISQNKTGCEVCQSLQSFLLYYIVAAPTETELECLFEEMAARDKVQSNNRRN